MGLVTAAAPLIASERGRRLHSVRDVRRTVHQTLRAATLFVLPAWALLWESESILLLMGQEADLAAQSAELMRGLPWALLPLLGFTTPRYFTSARERPGWGLVLLVCAIAWRCAGWG